MVRAADLQPIGSRFQIPHRFTNDLRQVVHTHVPLFTKQYKLVLPNGLYSWEGSCRSDVALAMRHRCSGIPTGTYRLNGLGKRNACTPLEYYGIFIFFMNCVT